VGRRVARQRSHRRAPGVEGFAALLSLSHCERLPQQADLRVLFQQRQRLAFSFSGLTRGERLAEPAHHIG